MTVKVIGIGDEGREGLLPVYQDWVLSCDILVGGKRQLANFPEHKGEKLVLEGGLKAVIETLKEKEGSTVVLASGDPMFFGVGGYLAKKLRDVEIYPFLSSIQLAFARMKESWQDCEVISVHGRTMKGLAQKINGKKKILLLTDKENTPSRIADYLLDYQMTEYKAFVGENLGGMEEKIEWFSLEKLSSYEASPLNVVVLKQTHSSPAWTLGIPDDEFSQRKPDKGLITKKEVRILSITALELHEHSIVWDIGTCTASVAIESARIAKYGMVYGIEKNEADLNNARENTKKFRTDIHLQHGKAPEGIDEWPDPDAIFIGGSGGDMEALLGMCCQRLKAGGTIVLNAVTIENLGNATSIFNKNGFTTDITLAQISRSKPILHMTRFESLNPIYIITAKYKEGQE
ncbi:precorrin-6y C5,15-methyltransferase (decarboxylating) subunit CbiE [Bacillus sp. FJAT-44742]|uniref:precorrin-6y C5,15-methyltransferase (decarboxylating) subunit CbiE n=1 Tax=Bacillus sp. FJAT-44742 TaxID=2014005 RepID=UPI000C24B557|nr:precorrin-6y C5,15-methyltransferase (decarboxylating) subunit CbiE [Bacillus sp. FJAT-44742]